MKTRLATLLLLPAAIAFAQGSGFPADATTPSAADIQQHLSGKAFDIKLADGSMWHVQYDGSGNYDFKSSKGFADHGDWQAQDGKVCSKGSKIAYSCNDVRMKGSNMFLKRDSGEVVEFVEAR
ncbi:hypothetical protein F4827_001191 [Paraburkholderia bannensis]|uniref:Uncharacterized protein n=1 Tax=Paraburkholderia bannensis TaxID=765414 RepID=A0A7W9TTV0_9BURK|nr:MULTISPECIES: hypothetical protein [Paraburkholderia]MBB3256358.1 hypothetical protein [Paraburkholderia sp. WP4_3_2]MBB6101357.1 hypothetical protein [Paraburkholderia bannensis]